MTDHPPVHLELDAVDGRARTGTLTTPHGCVATPCFMAVGTAGALKGITVQQAEAIGQGVLLANTYHLTLRPGCETVLALGCLHRFTGWRGPMLTDSGGYQVFSLADSRHIDETGVTFANHLDGTRMLLSSEESIRIQRFLGADIIMAFDECPPADAEPAYLRASVERTVRWLTRSVAAWRDDSQGWPGGDRQQALYGIVQGGLDPDLRSWSAEATLAHDLPGYAIGGLSVGESYEDRNRILDHTCPLLPTDRPRYLMGVGTPRDLVAAIQRGCDLFDCVLPTRMGRHGIAYTDAGPLHLSRAGYARDQRPIDPAIASPAERVCRGYLRHLLKTGEALGGQLVALHNLAYYQDLMHRCQTAIREQRFEAFAATFLAGYRAGAADSES